MEEARARMIERWAEPPHGQEQNLVQEMQMAARGELPPPSGNSVAPNQQPASRTAPPAGKWPPKAVYHSYGGQKWGSGLSKDLCSRENYW